MKRILSLLTVLALLAGCRQSDLREMTVEIKTHVSPSLEQKITEALAFYEGVKKNTLKWAKSGNETRLTLRFDSMQIAEMNILKAVEGAGCEVVYPELKYGSSAGFINTRKNEVK